MTKCVTTIFQIVNFVKFHSKCCDTAKKEKSCPRQKRFAVHKTIPTRSFFPFLYNLQQIKRKLYKRAQVFILSRSLLVDRAWCNRALYTAITSSSCANNNQDFNESSVETGCNGNQNKTRNQQLSFVVSQNFSFQEKEKLKKKKRIRKFIGRTGGGERSTCRKVIER